MKTRIMSLGVAAIAVAACTGGQGGEGLPFPVPRDPPPSGREPVDPGRDNAGPTRDTPSPERDTPGEQGSTGSGGACIACDLSYRCSVETNGQTDSTTITLETKDGQCEVKGEKVVLKCDGTFVSTTNGAVNGSWRRSGDGGFTATTDQLTTTCTPIYSPAPQGAGDVGH